MMWEVGGFQDPAPGPKPVTILSFTYRQFIIVATSPSMNAGPLFSRINGPLKSPKQKAISDFPSFPLIPATGAKGGAWHVGSTQQLVTDVHIIVVKA